MLFRAKDKNKFGSAITINGTRYPISATGLLDVTIPADVTKLQGIGEFEPKVDGFLPANAGQPIKGAMEFLKLYKEDHKLRQRLESIKDESLRKAFLKTMGFVFTDAELAAVVAQASTQEPASEPLSQPLPDTDILPIGSEAPEDEPAVDEEEEENNVPEKEATPVPESKKPPKPEPKGKKRK